MSFYLNNHKDEVVALLVLGMVAPLFFQLIGQVYNIYPDPIADSNGILMTVPLPIALLSCFVGLVLFVRSFDYIKLSSVIIATMIACLLLSVIVVGANYSKYILVIQNVIPIFGIIFGLSLDDKSKQVVPKAILFFLVFFIPIQVLATWIQGQLALTHYLYFFSVYQHYQYVPLIMVVLFSWVWVELRNTHIKYIYFLSPWIAIYSAAGNSILALVGLVAFSFSFAYISRRKKVDFIIPIFIVVFIGSYFYVNSQLAPSIQIHNKELGIAERAIFGGKLFDNDGHWLYSEKFKAPINVTQRTDLASLYYSKITESPKSLFFGHAEPVARKLTSSAHNYYLDLAYNFGVMACFPMLFLIIYTMLKIYQCETHRGNLVWLFIIVLYLVVLDSTFKVTLRQPYPGLIAFFLWGVVLRRIQELGLKR